jgi:hypothetical protein
VRFHGLCTATGVLEWLTVAVCACFRQSYTTRSVDLLCRIYSVTYRNNNLGGCCRGATQILKCNSWVE